MKTFGERLRHTRIRRGLSQAQLAHACGLSQSAISSYENGSRQSPKKLLNLAQALSVDIYWLSRGEGTAESASSMAATMHEHTAPWPFPSIEPHVFWSLKPKDRKTVETTVSALIDSLIASPKY
ncbi:helix-turn-helix domain-containing protein [Castellaniella sp.]|uniref:helix-turn-helix domain-containing protein n=1 Tax=Castellaniella sp. TaxID=1955812 RepID=UPI002AFE9EC3|nr:helix-turn-helix domain-containing protein [Castellaniella sp.]